MHYIINEIIKILSLNKEEKRIKNNINLYYFNKYR